MKGFLAVARREILEHRLIFAAGLAAGLLAAAAPLLPTVRGHSTQEVRDGVASFFALVFAIGVPILLGASTLVRDLAERRSSFYFSRPLSGLAIWAGKTAAAVAISLGTVLFILLPATLLGGGLRSAPAVWDSWPVLFAALAVGILLLVVLSHAVALVIASRSPLLLLDVALLVAAVALIGALARELFSGLALSALRAVIVLAASAAALALLSGGAAQVASGRTDLRRGRIALSAAFWSVAFLGVLACAGYAGWILSAGLGDLSVEGATAAPRGSWIAVTGRARGRGDYRPTFLLDAERGTSVRAGKDVLFSPDGTRAVWTTLRSWRRRSPVDLVTLELDRPGASPQETRISVSAWSPLVLSRTGERVASLAETVSVFEVPSGKLLGAARANRRSWAAQAFFAEPDLLRIWRRTSPAGETDAIQILEFDLRSKKLQETGSLEVVQSAWPLLADATGSRLIIRSAAGSKIALYDGRSGELLATPSEGDAAHRQWPALLSDGRIVIAESGREGAALRVLSSEGKTEMRVPLGLGRQVAPGGEVAPGLLVVAVGPNLTEMQNGVNGKIFLVDLARGTARAVAERLYPVASYPGWGSSDPTRLPAPGSEATKLFYAPNGSLVRFDPVTGERRTILPGR